MENRNFFRMTSEKSIKEFIESVKENAPKFNFGVRYIFDMQDEYERHNVTVDDDFKLYQIILCNYEKSYKTMRRNKETAAVLLQPKQIIAFTEKGETTINYLPFTNDFIKQALPQDEKLQESLPNSCRKIIGLIEASK